MTGTRMKIIDRLNSLIRPKLPPACPYCETILPKSPSRKIQCQKCHNYIYVRTKQRLYPSPLLTEDQAGVIDALTAIEYMGVSNEVFKKERELLSARFKQPASDQDTLWSIYNKLIIKFAKESSYENMSYIYSAMGLMQNKAKRDYIHLLTKAYELKLHAYKFQQRAEEVEIYVPDFECEDCRKLSKKRLSIDEATNTMPLPNKSCTYSAHKGSEPFCSCFYNVTKFKDLTY